MNGGDDEPNPADARARARAERRAWWITQCRAVIDDARARRPADDDEPVAHPSPAADAGTTPKDG